ncbi:DUF3788 domain-containing protein [Bordetella bronchialis]|uniref:DUF3788 domain-containing protein n=1 Tax=Bordetella bronchialis TaxID=463025 RepID=A0A193FTD6_9BORD|nr:DUF3788 domain-containing protein [Bordetella bronchialis]ANN70309.1 hypothetical protein BAU08_02200 [Bordetella bronchialis]
MNFRDRHRSQQANGVDHPRGIGDRINDRSAPPTESAVRDWLGPKAFGHWARLRSWIDLSYPGVFQPEWLYGGKKRGWALRYRKTRALCALLPGYRLLSVQVVLGRAERERFEERRHLWRPELLQLYDKAPAYPDGKWLTVAVSSAADRLDVAELVGMKRPPISRG